MHKRRLNEWTLYLLIEPDGPILIKSGVESGADPTLPAMNFVRTRHPGTGERTIYLPGSSLKGAIRSHVERIIRTVHSDDVDICCDPLGQRSCGKRCQNVSDTAEQYRKLCLACRIFGHTVHAGHLLTADAYPPTPMDTLPVRHNVAIDRLSGGAVGPFDLEVALEGRFETRLTLVNFERWQLGLLALALRDMAEGRLLLGYAKSRGLGRVKAHFGRLEIAYPGRFDTGDLTETLYGVGALAPDLVASYGYVAEDKGSLPSAAALVSDSVAWGRPAVRFGLVEDGPLTGVATEVLGEAHQTVTSVLASCVQAWADYRPGQGGGHG